MSNLGWFECADIRSVPELWTPARIDPAFWFDPSDSNLVTITDSRISQVADKSGNARHATQSIAGNRPVIAAGLCGRNVAYFDGSSRFLTLGTVLGKPANFSVFVVGMFTAQDSKRNMCGAINSTAQSTHCWGDVGVGRVANDCKVEYSIGDGTKYAYGRTSAIITTSQWFSGGWVYSGGNKPKWFMDGTEYVVTYEAGTATNVSGTAYAYSLGRNGEYATQYLIGYIAEIIIFLRALTTAEILRLSGYFAWKWGLTQNLAVSHAYKIQGPTVVLSASRHDSMNMHTGTTECGINPFLLG